MEVDYGGFSIREYTRRLRSVEVQKCWPFPGEVTGDFVQSLLPPITVAKFRWWSHELASLLTKSHVSVDDSNSPLLHKTKANAKSRPCKKRSNVEIFAAAPKIQVTHRGDERDDSDALISSKRRRTKDYVVQKNIRSKDSVDSGDRNFANKVKKCKEQDVEKCSFGIKESSGVISLGSNKVGSVSKDHEFQIPAILQARRKVCFVRSPDKSKTHAPQCEKHVRFSDQSGHLSQLKRTITFLDLCCLEMNRLSLSSSEVQSPVNVKPVKVMLSDPFSAVTHLESREQKLFQPAVSERHLGHPQAKSDLSCFPGPHLSSQDRVEDALGLERNRHVAQPIQPFISTSSESSYRTCSSVSQPTSADMHCGTLQHQSRFEPLVECMQKPVLHRQRNVEEAILRFPLNLQGELVKANGVGCRSLGRSDLRTGSSVSTATENNLLLGSVVDIPVEKKHSTEPALAKDSAGRLPAHNEKCHKYFPTRLGLDESFTEKSCFTYTNDGDCGHTVHSPFSEVMPRRSHTISMSKQNGLNRSVNNGTVISRHGNLCLQNTQATMRLIGKDVSVSTSYSGMVRTGERITEPDASIENSSLVSLAHQSYLWRRTEVEVTENHSIRSFDQNCNKAWLRDTSKDTFPLFCEPHVSLASQSRTNIIPHSEFARRILNQCCSFPSLPSSDKDLNFYGTGSMLPNSVTFSQQQLPLSSNYNNVGLVPVARESYLGVPFSCTDSARRSQALCPQSSFESSCSGISLYGSSSYMNVGTTNNNRQASVEEYPTQNHKFSKLQMQSGLNYAKEFFTGQQIRKEPM